MLLTLPPEPGAAASEPKTPEPTPPVERAVDFQADVLPIFEASCFKCHGPAMAMGGLRLHTRSDLLAGGDKGAAVLEGNSAGSRLIHLVAGMGDLKMPLDGEPLSPEQVGVLRAWIDQGAVWPQGAAVSGRGTPDEARGGPASGEVHWAFRPVRQDPPPRIADGDWIRNDIDAFVLQRLRSEGVEPSPEAGRSTLIRRLYLDLLGLPPTPAQRERFLSDRRPYAYERLVNRVLSSPHFGERWARHWLDLARYADSDGFEKDNVRPHAWRYREWVIDAYNRDLPYDQFVVEQLAGDLLPDATVEQKTATGFHRNTLTNTEGGVDPEEYRVEQVVDRTDTTGLAFMGLTVGCARCHSHKYDPISHREYYQLFSFFNTAIEKNIPAPLPREQVAYRLASRQWEREQENLLAALEEQRSELKEKLEGSQDLARWEKGLDHTPVEWIPLDLSGYAAAGGAEFSEDDAGALLVSGNNPRKDRYTLVANIELRGVNAVRLDFPTHESLPSGGPGRSPEGNFVLSEFKIGDARLSDPVKPTGIPVERVYAGYSQKGFEIEKAVDGDPKTGWGVNGPLGPNRDQQAVFVTSQSLGRYGGSSLTLTLEQLHGASHNIGSLKAYVTQAPRKDLKQVFPMPVERALAVPAGERSPEQQSALLDYYVDLNPEVRHRLAAVEGHRRARPRAPETMAQTLAQNPEPPRTHIHLRGDFLSPGEEVWPNTLSVLPPLEPRGKDPDRLDFAFWLTDPSHPLTPRVEVNRFWEHLFGRGLVATSEDFGTRGEKPSHPPAPGLAGQGVRGRRMEPQGPGPIDRDVGHLPAGVPRPSRAHGQRPQESAPGPAEPFPRRVGGDAGSVPGRGRTAGAPGGRQERLSAAAGGDGRPGIWRDGVAGELRDRPVSPGPLHLLPADRPVPHADDLRQSRFQHLLRSPDPFQHSAAGPDVAQRTAVRRERPVAGTEDSGRGSLRGRRSDRVRVSPGAGPRPEPPGSGNRWRVAGRAPQRLRAGP